MAPLFVHLVGTGSETGRLDAERLGGLEVEGQCKLCGLLHRQIGRLFAFQNPAGVDPDLTI
jgi:hypothetical protein